MAGDPRLTTRARKKLRMTLGLLWASQERPCAKCRKHIDYARGWDLDEIVPRVLGGDPMDIANLQPAHIRCNRSAGATPTQGTAQRRAAQAIHHGAAVRHDAPMVTTAAPAPSLGPGCCPACTMIF